MHSNLKRSQISMSAKNQCGFKKYLMLFILVILVCLSQIIGQISSADYKSILLAYSQLSSDHRNPKLKESFVTFVTQRKNYIELLDILLDSIHLFSTRPVLVFSVDFDLSINQTRHSRASTRQISQQDCGPSIFNCKLLSMIESNVDYGVQLEVDSVVNYHVDILFDMLYRWPSNLPLAPKHPSDPQNYKYYMQDYQVKYRTTPYMHGTFVWTYRAYPFLRSVFKLMKRGAFLDANVDETAMNVMLWKAKTKHILCKYDPFGPLFLSKYEKSTGSPECLPDCDGVYLIFHGQKEKSESIKIFERLKALGSNRPFVQTTVGIRWFNETNVTCCHPTATRPSSLHPLICEYQKYDPI